VTLLFSKVRYFEVMSKEVKDVSKLQPHDRLFKTLFSDPQNVKDFILIFLPEAITKHLDLEKLKIISSEKFSTFEKSKKLLDLIVECPIILDPERKVQIYFLFEHKSSPDKFIFVQILSYITALWEECLKRGEELIPVIPIVFYHGERKWLLPMDLVELFELPEGLREYVFAFKYLFFDTNEVSDEELLMKIALSNILIFGIYLLKNARRGREYIRRGFKEFFRMVEEFEERYKIYFREFLMYVIEVGEVDEEELEGILLEEGGEKVRSLVDKWIEQGYQKGIEQGIQQGLILEAQDMVLSAIEVKLGYIPEDVEKKIKNIFDREKLRNLLREIIKSENVLEILKDL